MYKSGTFRRGVYLTIDSTLVLVDPNAYIVVSQSGRNIADQFFEMRRLYHDLSWDGVSLKESFNVITFLPEFLIKRFFPNQFSGEVFDIEAEAEVQLGIILSKYPYPSLSIFNFWWTDYRPLEPFDRVSSSPNDYLRSLNHRIFPDSFFKYGLSVKGSYVQGIDQPNITLLKKLGSTLSYTASYYWGQ
jgi:hypothetical protein